MAHPISSHLVPRQGFPQQEQHQLYGLRPRLEREEPIFDIEINAHQERFSPREKPTIANNTNESSYDRLLKTREYNEKILNKIENDPFTLLTREIQAKNGWGNSFISDYEVSLHKSTELYLSNISEINSTQEKKVPVNLVAERNEKDLCSLDYFASKSLSHTYSHSDETLFHMECPLTQCNHKPDAGHNKLHPIVALERKETKEMSIASNKENINSPDSFDDSKSLSYSETPSSSDGSLNQYFLLPKGCRHSY